MIGTVDENESCCLEYREFLNLMCILENITTRNVPEYELIWLWIS